MLFGAGDRNRTGTVSLPQDFKSHAPRFIQDYCLQLSIYQYFRKHTPDYFHAVRVIVNNVYIMYVLYYFATIVSINKVLFALSSSAKCILLYILGYASM